MSHDVDDPLQYIDTILLHINDPLATGEHSPASSVGQRQLSARGSTSNTVVSPLDPSGTTPIVQQTQINDSVDTEEDLGLILDRLLHDTPPGGTPRTRGRPNTSSVKGDGLNRHMAEKQSQQDRLLSGNTPPTSPDDILSDIITNLQLDRKQLSSRALTTSPLSESAPHHMEPLHNSHDGSREPNGYLRSLPSRIARFRDAILRQQQQQQQYIHQYPTHGYQGSRVARQSPFLASSGVPSTSPSSSLFDPNTHNTHNTVDIHSQHVELSHPMAHRTPQDRAYGRIRQESHRTTEQQPLQAPTVPHRQPGGGHQSDHYPSTYTAPNNPPHGAFDHHNDSRQRLSYLHDDPHRHGHGYQPHTTTHIEVVHPQPPRTLQVAPYMASSSPYNDNIQVHPQQHMAASHQLSPPPGTESPQILRPRAPFLHKVTEPELYTPIPSQVSSSKSHAKSVPRHLLQRGIHTHDRSEALERLSPPAGMQQGAQPSALSSSSPPPPVPPRPSRSGRRQTSSITTSSLYTTDTLQLPPRRWLHSTPQADGISPASHSTSVVSDPHLVAHRSSSDVQPLQAQEQKKGISVDQPMDGQDRHVHDLVGPTALPIRSSIESSPATRPNGDGVISHSAVDIDPSNATNQSSIRQGSQLQAQDASLLGSSHRDELAPGSLPDVNTDVKTDGSQISPSHQNPADHTHTDIDAIDDGSPHSSDTDVSLSTSLSSDHSSIDIGPVQLETPHPYDLENPDDAEAFIMAHLAAHSQSTKTAPPLEQNQSPGRQDANRVNLSTHDSSDDINSSQISPPLPTTPQYNARPNPADSPVLPHHTSHHTSSPQRTPALTPIREPQRPHNTSTPRHSLSTPSRLARITGGVLTSSRTRQGANRQQIPVFHLVASEGTTPPTGGAGGVGHAGANTSANRSRIEGLNPHNPRNPHNASISGTPRTPQRTPSRVSSHQGSARRVLHSTSYYDKTPPSRGGGNHLATTSRPRSISRGNLTPTRLDFSMVSSQGDGDQRTHRTTPSRGHQTGAPSHIQPSKREQQHLRENRHDSIDAHFETDAKLSSFLQQLFDSDEDDSDDTDRYTDHHDNDGHQHSGGGDPHETRSTSRVSVREDLMKNNLPSPGRGSGSWREDTRFELSVPSNGLSQTYHDITHAVEVQPRDARHRDSRRGNNDNGHGNDYSHHNATDSMMNMENIDASNPDHVSQQISYHRNILNQSSTSTSSLLDPSRRRSYTPTMEPLDKQYRTRMASVGVDTDAFDDLYEQMYSYIAHHDDDDGGNHDNDHETSQDVHRTDGTPIHHHPSDPHTSSRQSLNASLVSNHRHHSNTNPTRPRASPFSSPFKPQQPAPERHPRQPYQQEPRIESDLAGRQPLTQSTATPRRIPPKSPHKSILKRRDDPRSLVDNDNDNVTDDGDNHDDTRQQITPEEDDDQQLTRLVQGFYAAVEHHNRIARRNNMDTFLVDAKDMLIQMGTKHTADSRDVGDDGNPLPRITLSPTQRLIGAVKHTIQLLSAHHSDMMDRLYSSSR